MVHARHGMASMWMVVWYTPQMTQILGWSLVGVALDEVVALRAVGDLEFKGLLLYLEISEGEVRAAA